MISISIIDRLPYRNLNLVGPVRPPDNLSIYWALNVPLRFNLAEWGLR